MQRQPDLLLAVKRAVDKEQPGRNTLALDGRHLENLVLADLILDVAHRQTPRSVDVLDHTVPLPA